MSQGSEERISMYREEARPAADRFTWYRTFHGLNDLSTVLAVVTQMQHDGVPADAVIQFSWPHIYAHWTRNV